MGIGKEEKEIFNHITKYFKDHVVTNTSPGRWTFAAPNTGNLHAYFTELPDDNFAITGDCGDVLFTRYRSLHWLRSGLRKLLEGKSEVSWGYIMEKVAPGSDIYEFDSSEYYQTKKQCEEIVAAHNEINRLRAIITELPIDEADEGGPRDQALNAEFEAYTKRDDLLDKSCYFSDVQGAQKHLDWHKENCYPPDNNSPVLWQSFCYENDYLGGEVEYIPDFQKISRRFLILMYVAAVFFSRAPSGVDGWIKGSLKEPKTPSETTTQGAPS